MATTALDRWKSEYPGTTLDQLRELDPELMEEVLRRYIYTPFLEPEGDEEDDAT